MILNKITFQNVNDVSILLFVRIPNTMMTRPDFEKKQIVLVFTMDGEKVSFQNDNLIVKDSDGKIIHQSTCYRVFALFVIGHITITSGIIEKSHRFGFPIYLMTSSLRTIDIIGHRTDGNTQLRKLQYCRDNEHIAKHIISNKITNQINTLKRQRINNWEIKDAIKQLSEIKDQILLKENNPRSLMGLEGNAAKIYFRHNFDSCHWSGRRPRIKDNMINSILDIGYTILFNYIDAMLSIYGFDTYCGILHTQFYMRKSLTCDMVEPFRPLIDWQVRKSINLGQFKEEHFNISNRRYLLDIRYNKEYVRTLIKPILGARMEIFLYFQSFYRAFMKNASSTFRVGQQFF